MAHDSKVINDPVHGFITLPADELMELIEHPYFQRLRRIQQLGTTSLVYPGAIHTRFHHALGAMHLMEDALQTLRQKGHEISEQEYQSALMAILLHDIGHGPFSHVLEESLTDGVGHEALSLLFMKALDRYFGGALQTAIAMFEGRYHRHFFHELVSSQLDMDRLDYLKRDCFFTGVSEGNIGTRRIIKMLNVRQDSLVIEEKGIYSIEHFLHVRRIMYWQVYLHKTTIAADQMLLSILRRARFLLQSGQDLPGSSLLKSFLAEPRNHEAFRADEQQLAQFARLDDYDVWFSVKAWTQVRDKVLSDLCHKLLARKLFRIRLSNSPLPAEEAQELKRQLLQHYRIGEADVGYYLVSGQISNAAYLRGAEAIRIQKKDGQVVDVAEASDLPHIRALGKIVKKHYLCWPKTLYL